MSERLAVPDWDRPGELWRVEPEAFMDVALDGICEQDNRRAVASLRRSGKLICDQHLRQSRMWVEGGRVVSWRLSR